MQTIQWTEEFSVGIDELDEQHRALVEMINALEIGVHNHPGQDATRRVLEQLNEYVRDHFALEERLMGGGGCTPELVARHFGEHAYFRNLLRDLGRDFENGRGNITVALIEHLVHWFLHHIVVVDRNMASQLNSSDSELDARVAAALSRDDAEELTETERYLLGELRRANDELEHRMNEQTSALIARNNLLEAELQTMQARVAELTARLEASAARG